MKHLELRYWWNGTRRCDIYPIQSKTALKEYRKLTKIGTPASLVEVCSTHDIIKEYAEIKTAEVVAL